MITARRLLPCAGAVLAAAALLGPLSTAGAADAVVFSDGFETGSTSAWTVTGAVADQQKYVRTGSWAALASGTGAPAYLRKRLGTGSAALQVSTAVDVVSQGTTPLTLLTVRRGTGAAVVGLYVTAKGVLTTKDFVTGAVTSSTTTMSKGAWHSLGLSVATGAPGHIDVTLDGTPVTALSKDFDLGTGALQQLDLADTAKSRTYKVAFDDVQVSAADLLPPTAPTTVTALEKPAGDRVTVAWVPSTDNVAVAGYDVYRDGTLLGSADLHTVFEDSAPTPDAQYTVVARDTSGNASPSSAVASPVVTQPDENPAGPLPPVGAVVQAAWPTYTAAQREQVIDAAVASNLQWLRVGVSWSRLQPRKPTATSSGYDMTGGVAALDAIVQRAHAAGLQVHLMLNATPGWANGGQGPKVLPTDPADYARVAQWVAARYAGSVQSMEVYNEPDLATQTVATPSQYQQLLCAAYPAIHTGSPGITVVSGSTAGNDWQWYQQLYDAGAKGCFDVLGTHPYQVYALPPEFPAPDTQKWWADNVGLVHDVMLAHGDDLVPIWFTEFGWSTHANPVGGNPRDVGVTEQEQAEYTVDMIRMTMNRYPYVQRMATYELRDESTGNLRNDNYGMYHLDMTPKPVAQSVSDLITSYATPTPDPVP